MRAMPSVPPLHHLLHVRDLSTAQLDDIFTRANAFMASNRAHDKKQPELKGRTLINLFYENSTRTRSSFELAGKRLGMDVVNISASASSTQKGESLIDTLKTLEAMQPDAIVIRHPQSGAAELCADYVSTRLINAGDGANQHPTQALLDTFTIRQYFSETKGLKVIICGDISHSRVARSNAFLLGQLGAEITFVAPPQLMPSGVEALGVKKSYDFDASIKGADIIMMLRLQHERMSHAGIASVRDYFCRYGLTHQRLAHANANVKVMHPGPVNRGVEIDGALVDDPAFSLILYQVEAGVAIRQALLAHMLTP